MRKFGSGMGICIGLSLASGALFPGYLGTAFAEEDPIAQEETAAQASAASPEWDAAIQKKYGLTNEQTAELRAKGFNNPQIAILSQLAQTSGKPLADVVKMREESKMGWGKIAKELGVHPSEIGQSVSSMRRELKQERRSEARAAAKERRESRREQRMERKEKMRQERQERKSEHKGQKH